MILHVLYFASPNAKVRRQVDLRRHAHHARRRGSSPRRSSRSTSRSSAPTTRPTARSPASSSSCSGSGSRTWRCCSASSSTRRRSARASCGRGSRSAEQELKVPERDRPSPKQRTVRSRLSTLGRRCRRPSPTSPRCASAAPPRRLVEARDEAAIVAAVRAADAAGEPLLDRRRRLQPRRRRRRLPRHRRCASPRAAIERRARARRAAGEPWDPFVAALRRPRAWPASSASPASPARSARRRSRTSAPTARRSPTSIVSVRAYDRAHAARCVDDPGRGRAASPTARARSSATPAAGSCSRSTFDLAAAGDARCRSATPSWRARSASRRAATAPLADVREAVLALRRAQGHGRRPGRPRLASRAGSFFTNPVLSAGRRSPRSRRASATARARPRFPQPDGRVKTSAAWLIEHAGLRARPRRPGDDRDLLQAHARADQPRRGTTAELVALAREIADGVHERFGVELEPEPVFAGHAWRS